MSMQRFSIPSTTEPCSNIWTSVPSSSEKISLTIFDLCSHIHMIPDVNLYPIKKLIIRKDVEGFHHESLLVLLAKPQSEEFWVHLERRWPPSITLGKALDENGIVSAVINLCCSFTTSPFRQSFQGSFIHCWIRPT